MAQTIDTASHLQAVAPVHATSSDLSQSYSHAKAMAKAMADAVVLSSEAIQVIDQLKQGKTIAEAWLDHITAPPDLNRINTSTDGGSAQAGVTAADDTVSAVAVNRAAKAAASDMSWLLDALHPPKVDTSKVVQELMRRMSIDNVGVNPPLPEIRAQAEHTGTVAALYVENLTVTVQRGTVTDASIDRVALTTVDPSIRDRVAGSDRPVVVDVSGNGDSVAAALVAANEAARQKAAELVQQQQAEHALLIVRQGGNRQPEGTIRVKLDALLPL